MTKENLTPNNIFSHVPANAIIEKNSACAGCPLAESHKTCTSFKPITAAVEDNKISLKEMRNLQWQIHRKDLDIYSEDFWGARKENARDSYNFADSVTAEIVSASGKLLTLEFNDDPRNLLLFSSRMREPEVGASWITGMGGFGPIRPGMRITYSNNSVMAYKSKPTITKIVSRSGSQLVVELDQDANFAMYATTEALNEAGGEPIVFTAAIWNQDGNPAQWLELTHPTYFFGSKQVYTLQSEDLPENGIVELADKPIAHPISYDPENFKPFELEGKRIDNGSWEVIYANERVFIDNEKSVIALKTAVPSNAVFDDALFDLTTAYSDFKISYYVETTSNAHDCAIVGFGRCKHDKPDYTKSIGNYGAENGVGIVGENHWYCSQRKTPKWEFEDTNDDGLDDKANLTWETATGAATYRPGRCLKYNTCNKFEEAETDPNAFFMMKYHGSKFFREIWFSTNSVIEQHIPGYNFPMNYVIKRIKHASLASLLGYVGSLNTEVGMHPTCDFYGVGSWAPPVEWEYPEETGIEGVYLSSKTGYNWASRAPFVDIEYSPTEPAPKGYYPDKIINFKEQRNPIDASDIREVAEILGTRVIRDKGEMYGRGTAQTSKVGNDSPVILPNLSFTSYEEQFRSVGKFVRLETPMMVGLNSYGGYIEIFPLRQFNKSVPMIGSRTIHSVNKLNTTDYEFEFVNERQVISYIEGESGDRYDQTYPWYAGGAAPIYPPDYLLPNTSYHSEDYKKSFGSQDAGVRPCDTMTIQGIDKDANKYIVKEVKPFGGSEADDWGSKTEIFDIVINEGFWLPWGIRDETDTVPANIATIQYVKYAGTDTNLLPVAKITRPREITAEGTYYWEPETQRMYFSYEDAGSTIEIGYTLSDDPDYNLTNGHYVLPEIKKYNVVSSAKWGEATDIAVSYPYSPDYVSGNWILTPTAAPVPSPGEYKIDDDGTGIHLVLSLDDAARAVRLELTFPELAIEPDDDISFSNNYKAYAKKRDSVIIIDESRLLSEHLTTLPGKTVQFYYGGASFFPDDNKAYFTPYQEDDFQEIADIRSESSLNRIWIPESFFDDKTGGCIKL